MPHRVLAILVIVFALTLSAPVAGATSEMETIDAVWRPQQVTFVYFGHTTQYSCHTLEQKVKLVLQVLGAHEDIVFDRSECSGFSPARLRVTFRSPVVASDENIEILTTATTEQQLVARLNNREIPRAEDLVRFPAAWQEISFARNRTLKIDAADCEFVEHVRRQLLPKLSVRVLQSRGFCTPGYPGISPPRLKVSALLPTETVAATTN